MVDSSYLQIKSFVVELTHHSIDVRESGLDDAVVFFP